ncbi:MAG: hypothetical protein Q9181_002673 [Wetmoreana brouardii]
MGSKGEYEVRANGHNLTQPTPRQSTLGRLLSSFARQRPNDASAFASDHLTRTNTSEEDIDGKGLKPESGTLGERGDVNGLEQFYIPIDTYEGRHRYDPRATWAPEEERALIRRLDLRVCAYCCLMFFCLQLDRGNISQALSDDMLKDLGLNTNDYNTGQTIFYVSFLAAELPSQLISKKLGPVCLVLFFLSTAPPEDLS